MAIKFRIQMTRSSKFNFKREEASGKRGTEIIKETRKRSTKIIKEATARVKNN